LAQCKKIAFIEGTAEMGGGVEFSTLYLAEKLNSNNWQPVVICPQEGSLTKECQQRNIAVKIVQRPKLYTTSMEFNGKRIPNLFALALNPLTIAQSAYTLSSFLKAESADLVVTKGLMTHIYGGLAAKRAKIPCIWHLQDYVSQRYFGLYSKIFGQLAKFLPDHIIVDGGSIARQLPTK
jgi:UDP-N-acetylglucosamine:LPS N-acetylglucosamine transferase